MKFHTRKVEDMYIIMRAMDGFYFGIKPEQIIFYGYRFLP
jgi:hypothetical protein